MAAITATWNVSLYTECPYCNEYVDLLTYPDFWDGQHLEIGEYNTQNSKDIEVNCPECGSEFVVDLEY